MYISTKPVDFGKSTYRAPYPANLHEKDWWGFGDENKKT